MTRSRIVLVLAFSGAVLAGCAGKKAEQAQPTAAAAQPSTPVVEVTASTLNIRATASPTGAVVGALKRGERANAPQAASGGWLYVETDAGAKGYVASQYVRAVEAPAAAPPAAAPAAAAPAPAPSAPAKAEKSAKAPAKPAPPGSKLAKVTNGMSEAQVIEILGAPTSQQNYMTGKAWIPYYYGSDTSRLDYRYKGVGIVVFSRSRYSGGTKVIRVDYDPSEDGLP
ncbi:MAG: SH3 domain-containing protein [Deltaproteobacteria bacterium]|nr:SH3 domain-containing protein [Deltaproteobacteria bacterium]